MVAFFFYGFLPTVQPTAFVLNILFSSNCFENSNQKTLPQNPAIFFCSAN